MLQHLVVLRFECTVLQAFHINERLPSILVDRCISIIFLISLLKACPIHQRVSNGQAHLYQHLIDQVRIRNQLCGFVNNPFIVSKGLCPYFELSQTDLSARVLVGLGRPSFENDLNICSNAQRIHLLLSLRYIEPSPTTTINNV